MACKDGFIQLAKQQIVIESYSTASDSQGGQVETWSTLYTVWAIIEPKSGREGVLNEALDSTYDCRITIRYIAALKNTKEAAKYRVVFDGRTYGILDVKNIKDFRGKIEGKDYQVLNCKEGDLK